MHKIQKMGTYDTQDIHNRCTRQAGAELCPAKVGQKLWLKLQSKLAVEVVIKVGVQLLFWVGGGGWVGGGRIKLKQY